MLVKTCKAPNGPLPWNHPCLQSFQGSHAVLFEEAQQGQMTNCAAASWAFDLAIFGWLAFFIAVLIIGVLVKEWRGQKTKKAEWQRRSCRLAATATSWMEAFNDVWEEKNEQSLRHQEESEALECGSTMLLRSSDVDSTFKADIVEASFKTMHARMEMEPVGWMHWRENDGLFAFRSWGGVVWRWLSSKVCELVSIGSCGASAGSLLVSRMLTLISGQAAHVVVLKSLARAESFWENKGFERLTSKLSMPLCDYCARQTTRILEAYRGQSNLSVYAQHLAAADLQQIV